MAAKWSLFMQITRMKTLKNIYNLISSLITLSITKRKMPELIPVRVVTKVYRDNLK